MSWAMDPLPVITVVGLPMATMSGFTRPSCVGPTELKGAFVNKSVTAPTVRQSSASAGKVIFFQGPIPELPAELTSIIPFFATIEAEWLIKVE